MNKFLNFMRDSVSAYHATKNMADLLIKSGFIPLEENKSWHLEANSKYFVVRNNSAIIAFTTPNGHTNYGLNITASHSDSPTFKLKPNCLLNDGKYIRFNTEVYGGPIFATWLDKPLSIAGKVLIKNETGIETRLMYIDKDILVIPNLAPHMKPEVAKGITYNAQIDMLPFLGLANDNLTLENIIAKELGISVEAIIDFDLVLVNRQRARLLGYNNDMIMSPQLDDLASAYTSLQAFLNSKNKDSFNVFACFDNEEVGSRTRQGAGSKFMFDVIERSLSSMNYKKEEINALLANSFLISVDNAHAVNPNQPSVSDVLNKTYLNEGVVLKYNANQSYTTDAFSAAYVQILAKEAKVKLQKFANRSDIRGGSTLGAISSGQVSIHAADIGLPQLAMHSSNEVCGVLDLDMMIRLLTAFYDHSLIIENDEKLLIK